LIAAKRTTVLACGVVSLALAVPGCLKKNPEFVGATSGSTSDDASATADDGITTSGGPGPADGSTTVTPLPGCAPNLESIRLAVFSPTCTVDGCHAGDVPAANLDLETVDLFEDLLDIASTTCLSWSRVVAGAPQQSILYAKVAGLATCEVDRPVEHEPLTSEDLDCIAGWIESIEDCERCEGTECIDLVADPGNCGACGFACPPGIACGGGQCNCPGGGIPCGGACIDPLTSTQHCGGCDNDCEGNPCAGGECQCVGLTECGGCVDTATDPDHCGGCDQPCEYGRSCDESMCGCSETVVSLATDVQPIFTATCVANGCHGGNNPKKDLSLEAGLAWSNLVDVTAL
jgi:hypothetical protein